MNKAQSMLLYVGALACLISIVSGLVTKRDYNSRTYYAIQSTEGVDLLEALDQIQARLEHPIGKLKDHYLISTAKNKRSLSLQHNDDFKFIEEQIPRQRTKRRPPLAQRNEPQPGLERETTGDDLNDYIAAVQEELDIHDPIFHEQWHLFNTREAGHDINVTGVWQQGIFGKGTVVALVDDGIDMNSVDLAANYYAAGSYDYNDHNPVPSPKLSDDNHGTRCAGEIAAVRNDVCGIGIAYEAKVAGLRILSGRITDADESAALNYDFDNNLIYSCSWGPPDDGRSMDAPSIIIQRAIVNGIQNGRGGKGSIFVFASGNGAVYDDNCNFDGYTNSIFSITIGGIDRMDFHPYYSELCAPQLAVTYSSGAGDYIHTTDVGERSCSDRHGGTSAAAPIGAGIFALVLSIRPDLSWRDMQYLCVETAVAFNPEDDDWQETPAGFKFNHKFGYGKLDAYAMVERAKTWQNVKSQSWLHTPLVLVNEELGTEPHQEITSHFEVSESDLSVANLERIEHITVNVNIEHQRRGDITVDLISPHGIISNLATMRRYDADTNGIRNWTFMTVKHWGESGIGQWRLVVGDHDHPESTGTFIDWKMTLWGEAKDESKAIALPIPGDDTFQDPVSSSTVVASIAISTVPPKSLPPLPTASTNAIPSRPVISTHAPMPTTIIQPLPEEEQIADTGFDWKSRKAIWIYVATGLILVFVSALGIWLYIHKYRGLTTREDYEFKELRNVDNSEPAGELYDAFAVARDSEDDRSSRDSLDELESQHK